MGDRRGKVPRSVLLWDGRRRRHFDSCSIRGVCLKVVVNAGVIQACERAAG